MSGTPKIGIWGPTGSGKTTYLGALYLELQKEWSIVNQISVGPDSNQLTIHIANNLANGEFPPATSRQSRHYALFFHPDSPSIGRRLLQRKFELSLIEAPGDFTGRDPGLRADDEISKYYEHIGECTGLILMIDSDAQDRQSEDQFGVKQGSYYLALQKLFSALDTDKNGKVLPKIAFCLSKADIDHPGREIDNTLAEKLVHQIVGEDTRNLIQSKCQTRGFRPKVRYYAISSVGMYTVAGQSRPNIHFVPRENKFQIAKPAERKPIQVADPLYWLLE